MTVLAATAAIVVSGGALSAPKSLSRAELAGLLQTEAKARFHDQDWSCTGPRLATVLQAAGAAQPGELRGAALAHGVIAEGADGYRVLFSRGELDEKLGNAPVIVALSCNGTAIADADGPVRLLSGGDQRGARSVRQLVRLQLVELPK